MLFIMPDGDVLDGDLDLLQEQLRLLEGQVQRLHEESAASGNPDGEGILDRAEALVGLAFVACQRYVNATYRDLNGGGKPGVLQQGPSHGGRFTADLIDAGASLWKHSGEWGTSGRLEVREGVSACPRAPLDHP